MPNFGRDKDVIAGEENLKVAEEMLGHKWTWKDKSRDIPPVVGYYQGVVPPDADIATTAANLAQAEKDLGHKWVV